MKTAGTYIAIAGVVIIVLYVFYIVVKAIVSIPFLVMVGLALIILGAILLFVSLIRERVTNSKKEDFKEIES